MLPERSTAISKSRPLIGIATASPTNCGRAAATSTNAQSNHNNPNRQEDISLNVCRPVRFSNSPGAGTRSAASPSSRSVDIQILTNHGTGKKTNIHHQASCHIDHFPRGCDLTQSIHNRLSSNASARSAGEPEYGNFKSSRPLPPVKEV